MVGIVIYLTIAAKYHAHAYSANKLINEPLITALLPPLPEQKNLWKRCTKKVKKLSFSCLFTP